THAFFKACLFLGSGAVIHGLQGEQDIQRMGGLRRYMPSTRTTFLIATIAITGILPISGFFSKDEILGQALHTRAFGFLTLGYSGPHLTFLGPLIYAVGSFSAFLTSFYMWRCYFLTFSGEYRGPESVHPHESPSVMTLPLWILAGLSVVGLVLGLPQPWVHGTALQGWTWEHFTEGVFSRPRGGATLIDGLFVNGIPSLIAWISAMARRFQNGDVQRYAAVTALGVAALLYVFLVRG